VACMWGWFQAADRPRAAPALHVIVLLLACCIHTLMPHSSSSGATLRVRATSCGG
jgi:hypothetical protein